MNVCETGSRLKVSMLYFKTSVIVSHLLLVSDAWVNLWAYTGHIYVNVIK